MAEILYQGHGSLRIKTKSGTVVYIDPYAGEGYDLKADLVLITHAHYDHTDINKVNKDKNTVILTYKDMLINGEYKQKEVKDLVIKAVPAENKNHKRSECVGYIVKADDKVLYFAGDTSYVKEMDEYSSINIDYAFLPCDGVYNMDNREAEVCSNKIKAKHTVPIHNQADGFYDYEKAKEFNGYNKLIVKPTEKIIY